MHHSLCHLRSKYSFLMTTQNAFMKNHIHDKFLRLDSQRIINRFILSERISLLLKQEGIVVSTEIIATASIVLHQGSKLSKMNFIFSMNAHSTIRRVLESYQRFTISCRNTAITRSVRSWAIICVTSRPYESSFGFVFHLFSVKRFPWLPPVAFSARLELSCFASLSFSSFANAFSFGNLCFSLACLLKFFVFDRFFDSRNMVQLCCIFRSLGVLALCFVSPG